MSPAEEEEVKQLLNKWNLSHLFPVFQDECIDIVAINLMNDRHIQKLVTKHNIKIGIEVKLEENIKAYQRLSQQNKVPCSSSSLQFDEIQDIPENKASNNQDESTDKIDVYNILQSSVQGRAIINIFENNKSINEGSRAIIVDIIINHMIQNGIRMTVGMAKHVSEKILEVFPTEFMAYYYSKQIGKKPQGKIYDKYFNSQRHLKTSGVLTKRSYSSKLEIKDRANNVCLESAEKNISEQLEAIFTDNCSWASLEHHWEATKNYRLNEILNASSTTNILNKWKHYKKPMGYKLVNIDFHHLYPSASSLIINYDVFASKIMPIFVDKIKDPNSKKLLEELIQMQHVTESGRSCAIFQLLHSVLVPTTTTVEGINNKRVRTKYSISDSQGSFLILGRTVAECEEELIRRNSNKIPIQPLVMITGTILHPKEFLVYFDGVKYILTSFIDAVDIYFKIFNVFNLEFPIASHLVWRFIQKMFYKIKTKYDKPNVHIDCLISGLQ